MATTVKNPKLNRRAVAEGADYFEDTCPFEFRPLGKF